MKRSVPPRTYNKRRQQRHARVRRTIFYNLRQGRKRAITPRVANKRAPVKPPPKTIWENIVLHYLYKLKNNWTSKPKPVKDIFARSSCRRSLARPSASNSRFSFGSSSYNLAKTKALSIVKNAVEYGQAKGIISKNGRFFCIKDSDAKLPRKVQSAGMRFCADCEKCRKLMRLQGLDSGRAKSISPFLSSTSCSTKSTAKSKKEYYSSKAKHPKPLKREIKKRIQNPVRYQYKYNKRNRKRP